MSPLPMDAESVLLIIENFDGLRAQLTKHFTDAGYDLYSSATLKDAMAIACQNVPDVVLLDYELRGADALKALAQMRECLPQSYIVLVAPEDLEIRARAFRAGASKVIPKSNKITELEEIAAPRCVWPRKKLAHSLPVPSMPAFTSPAI